MLYRLLFYTGTLAILSMYACKKEKSMEGLVTETHCGYSPYSSGSFFNYQYTNSSGDKSEYSVIVAGDTTINGQLYSILFDGSTNQFIRCTNGSYFLYEQELVLPGYQLEAGDRLFLRDNYNTGASWEDTVSVIISGVEQKGLLQYHILQQQAVHTVMGKEYKNVIVVRQDAAIIAGETVFPAGTIATYYYALGVGHIETDSPTDTIRLLNYAIR